MMVRRRRIAGLELRHASRATGDMDSAQVLVNGTPIYDERSEAIVLESRNQDEPEVLQTLQVPVNLSMRTGEVLTLNLYLTHHCKGTQAIMLWGGDGEFRSGLHLEGPMIQPLLEVNVDDAGLLHIQLVPDLLGDGRRSRPSISTSGVRRCLMVAILTISIS